MKRCKLKALWFTRCVSQNGKNLHAIGMNLKTSYECVEKSDNNR